MAPWGQALVLLAFLAKGDTFEQLGCHFRIGAETARRYVNEGIDALAALGPSMADASPPPGKRGACCGAAP
ncbi:transposase family protein [Streptomyces sp. NPDC056411]|uniref:transposase family protein n=1 Tax=Streptomyces sp. NPDC056411 TaxID=3345813 RepID=UPI0035E1C0C3